MLRRRRRPSRRRTRSRWSCGRCRMRSRPASASPSRPARSRRPPVRSPVAASKSATRPARWSRPGSLGDTPWPGTDALHWTELTLPAPPREGTGHVVGAARCVGARAAARGCDVIVQRRRGRAGRAHRDGAGDGWRNADRGRGNPPRPAPRHHRTVRQRAGPHRQGPLRAAVWKAGYEVPVTPVEVQADAVIESPRCRSPRTIPTRIGRDELVCARAPHSPRVRRALIRALLATMEGRRASSIPLRAVAAGVASPALPMRVAA